MDDEVEDLVGDVKYTDSQKSVTTSAVYSLDFTDSSSDKNNSSGKETYIIEHDSDDSDKTFNIHNNESIIDLTANRNENANEKYFVSELNNRTKSIIDRAAFTSLPNCNIEGQEIFTQTSKTIIEIAQNESFFNTPMKTLETQTSFVSITENKKIKYKIHILGANYTHSNDDLKKIQVNSQSFCDKSLRSQYNHTNQIQINVLEDSISNTTIEKKKYNDANSFTNSDKDIIQFIEEKTNDEVENEDKNQYLYENSSDFESSFDSNIETDSLIEIKHADNKSEKDEGSETSEVNTSIDNDVEELYNRLSKSPQLLSPVLYIEPSVRKFGLLTPLTEETVQKKDSIFDLTPSIQTSTRSEADDSNALFVHNSSVRIRVLSDDDKSDQYEKFKLPPIHYHQSCPKSPKLNFLFSLNNHKPIEKSSTLLPCFYENQYNKFFDRWEIKTKELACGESPRVTLKNDSNKSSKDPLHLPPIHLEGFIQDSGNRLNILSSKEQTTKSSPIDEISINGKIKELKMNARKTRPRFSSRSGSPSSVPSPDETRLCDTAEKGCDVLCSELLRRLRSSSWVEITETLVDLPKALEKFWSTISEFRIADLIRQATVHIESPRTQVARSACKTVAEILRKTNYTKKPDFYETISTLLTKTGSYNRPVRREANVALDSIVCSVDVTHCVTAICIYGVGHKSALVRCASARLLVVCCALAQGGRQVLRPRPRTAAAARRHALVSLAELLQDKNTETRKYAERLYSMLRPLTNFEAYFLTDVDVELASKLMKKYDQLLIESKTNQ